MNSTVNHTTTARPAALEAHVEPLPASTQETCDGCGPATSAAATVILPSGGLLTLCGHHSVPFGYEHPEPQSRHRGSGR